MKAGLRKGSVGKFFEVIERLGRRLRNEAYGTGDRLDGKLTDRFPGLAQLFGSLVSASVTGGRLESRRIEEWNPFSQRVLLSDPTPPQMSELENSFTLLALCVRTFVEWGHEAIHVLALEPFFCGQRPIRSKADFIDWNLAGEAVSFWYADMVMTPIIRRTIPNAELIYNRSAVSNVSFHPEQAFAQIGITQANDSLPLYIAAFLNKDSMLTNSNGVFAKALTRQLRGFYPMGRQVLANWYSVLKEFDFFEGYFVRFCGRKNLPSLWSADVLSQVSHQTLDEYAIRLGIAYLPDMAAIDDKQIAVVAARRHIQTRAYFAWLLHQAARKGWIASNRRAAPEASVSTDLARYLDLLEESIDLLTQNRDLKEVIGRVRQADRAYNRTVHAALVRNEGYMKYRYRLYPFFGLTGGLVGLADQRSGFSTEEMTGIVQHQLSQYDWQKGCDVRGVSAAAADFFVRAGAGRLAPMRDSYNRFMRHPEILARWSVRLAELRPGQNQFRELAFEYT